MVPRVRVEAIKGSVYGYKRATGGMLVIATSYSLNVSIPVTCLWALEFCEVSPFGESGDGIWDLSVLFLTTACESTIISK